MTASPTPTRTPTVTATVTPEMFRIIGRVWLDLDGNGQVGPTEKGIPGVRLSLLTDGDRDGQVSAEDVVQAQATTDAQGEYVLEAIPTGAYVLMEADPSGFSSTTPNVMPIQDAGAGQTVVVNFGDLRRLLLYLPLLRK